MIVGSGLIAGRPTETREAQLLSASQASVAVIPPSTGITAPVIYDARSEQRNDASSATSSGCPPRLRAVPWTSWGNRSAAPGPPDSSVSMKPGQMAMARMPRVPYSTAAALVKEMTPAFAAEYTLTGKAVALIPPVDDQLRITPPPQPSRVLMPCLVPKKTPRKSTSMTRSYSSAVTSASGAAAPIPATLRTASTRPKTSSAAANMASTWFSLVTSQRNGTTASPSSAAVSSSRPLMSAASTRAPSRTKARLQALAIPEPAPVITATLPSSSFIRSSDAVPWVVIAQLLDDPSRSATLVPLAGSSGGGHLWRRGCG